MKIAIKTAEQQLQEILDKYKVNKLEHRSDNVYSAITPSNQAIVVRKDSEDDHADDDGIHIEIFPPYDQLRRNKTVLDTLRQDAIVNKNWAYLGTLTHWIECGDADCKPDPVNLYYADVIDIAGGDAFYLTDDADEGNNGAEYKERHDYMLPYISQVQQMKDKLIFLITYDFQYNKQVFSGTPIRYVDEHGLAKSVGVDACNFISLQMSKGDAPSLQLRFFYGDNYESPDYSLDVPLEKLSVESLIQIYENLM